MQPSFERCAGLLLTPVGEIWAAFSPLSGETVLLNDESAAILEILANGPFDLRSICDGLATDAGLDAAALYQPVNDNWQLLMDAGLVRASAATACGRAFVHSPRRAYASASRTRTR